MSVTPSEEAQIHANVRVARQGDKRDVAACMQLRESLLALLAGAEVNSTGTMIRALEVLGLKVTPEFSQKDFGGMRAAIRDEFIPSLDAATQIKADRIGQDVEFPQVAAYQQAAVESPDSAREPSPELFKQALQAMEKQHKKTDAALLEEGLYRDEGIRAIPFENLRDAIMEDSDRGLAYRRTICYLHGTNGPLTPVARNGNEIALFEGREQSASERGDMVFNLKAAQVINEPDRPNVVATLYGNGAILPSVNFLHHHLKPFSDRTKCDSSWAAQRDGMTREELEQAGVAARFIRNVGGADDYEADALGHLPGRCGRGALWVQMS